MFKYILKRIGISILILLGVSFILYALLRCMPTDFVEAKILALNTSGNTVTEEFKQQMADPDFEGYCHCMLYYKAK